MILRSKKDFPVPALPVKKTFWPLFTASNTVSWPLFKVTRLVTANLPGLVMSFKPEISSYIIKDKNPSYALHDKSLRGAEESKPQHFSFFHTF